MFPKSRAQENGISTKRLRRMAHIRLERIRIAASVIRQEWNALDDLTVDEAVRSFLEAADRLESDLAGIAEYHDQPIGAD